MTDVDHYSWIIITADARLFYSSACNLPSQRLVGFLARFLVGQDSATGQQTADVPILIIINLTASQKMRRESADQDWA